MAEIVSIDVVLDALKTSVIKAKGTTRWGHAHGVTGGYVRQILRGERRPNAHICEAVGFRIVDEPRKYERIE